MFRRALAQLALSLSACGAHDAPDASEAADAGLPDSGEPAISACGKSDLVLPPLGDPEEACARIEAYLGARPARQPAAAPLVLEDPAPLNGTTRYKTTFQAEESEPAIPG